VKTARFLILIASAVHVAIPAAQARDFWLEDAKRSAIELNGLSGDNWLVHSHGALFPPPYPTSRCFPILILIPIAL
jgi:hypothetical protein